MSEDYRPGDFWHNPQETLDEKNMLSGAGIMDSANTLSVGVGERNDVAIGLGATGLALDTLGLAIDPVGSLVSAAIGWLIDHVTPFRVPLDMMMGDPIGIEAAQKAIDEEQKKLKACAEDHKNALAELRKSWRGEAADAFTKDMEGLGAHLDALGKYVDSASQQMGIAGGLVGAFRGVIRDIIAGVLGGIIAGAFAAAAAMPFTFGASVPIFLGTVAATVGITMTKIGVQIAKLTQKLTKGRANVDETGKIGDDAAKAFDDAASGGAKPTPGGGAGKPGAGAGKPGDKPGKPGDGTTPSKPDLTVDTSVPKPTGGNSPSSGGTEYFTPDTSPRPGSATPGANSPGSNANGSGANGSPGSPSPDSGSGGAGSPGSGANGPNGAGSGSNGSISSTLDGGPKPSGDANKPNVDNANPGDGGKQNGDTSLKPGHKPPSDQMIDNAKESLNHTIADKLPHIRPGEHRIIMDKFDQYANMGKPDLTKALGDQGAARFESIVKTLTDPGYGARGFLGKSSVEFIKSMGDVHKETNMNDE